jgi:hypothetical protein
MKEGDGGRLVVIVLVLIAAFVVGDTEWGRRVGDRIANPIGAWGYELAGFGQEARRFYGYEAIFNRALAAAPLVGTSWVSVYDPETMRVGQTGLEQLREGEVEMDDVLGFVLVVLFGILGIFILVRIVNAASRSVDKEQEAKRRPALVRLGMTPAEVESALGPPQTRVDLGPKVLYKYKDMTFEFRDGKVTDVR